jgi:hypothetical protein
MFWAENLANTYNLNGELSESPRAINTPLSNPVLCIVRKDSVSLVKYLSLSVPSKSEGPKLPGEMSHIWGENRWLADNKQRHQSIATIFTLGG